MAEQSSRQIMYKNQVKNKTYKIGTRKLKLGLKSLLLMNPTMAKTVWQLIIGEARKTATPKRRHTLQVKLKSDKNYQFDEVHVNVIPVNLILEICKIKPKNCK